MKRGDLLVTLIINQVRLDRELCLAFRLVNWRCLSLIEDHQHVDQEKTCGHNFNFPQHMVIDEHPYDISGLLIKRCWACYTANSLKYLTFDHWELFQTSDENDYDFAIAYANHLNIPYVEMSDDSNNYLIFIKKHMKEFIQDSKPRRKKRRRRKKK